MAFIVGAGPPFPVIMRPRPGAVIMAIASQGIVALAPFIVGQDVFVFAAVVMVWAAVVMMLVMAVDADDAPVRGMGDVRLDDA